MGKFYIFFRNLSVATTSGDMARQQITIYARNLAEAQRLVANDLKMQAGPGSELMTSSMPPFQVRELPLDAPQVLTSVFSAK